MDTCTVGGTLDRCPLRSMLQGHKSYFSPLSSATPCGELFHRRQRSIFRGIGSYPRREKAEQKARERAAAASGSAPCSSAATLSTSLAQPQQVLATGQQGDPHGLGPSLTVTSDCRGLGSVTLLGARESTRLDSATSIRAGGRCLSSRHCRGADASSRMCAMAGKFVITGIFWGN